MLRYKTETRPGLVASYDIRPGNGAGQNLTSPEPARDGAMVRQLAGRSDSGKITSPAERSE